MFEVRTAQAFELSTARAPVPEPAASHYRTHAERSADQDLEKLFDGTARRRRVAWMLALFALLVVAGTVLAAVASHYRPS